MQIKYISVLALVISVNSFAECQLVETSVSKGQLAIQERGTITRDIVPTLTNQQACQVRFRVRIDNQWHDAIGSTVWASNITLKEACGQAVSDAESKLIERLGRQQVVQHRTMICSDDSKFGANGPVPVGQVGDIGQFRPNPTYPKEFVYNGTLCRYFLETVYDQTVRTKQGIICRIENSKWVVVDKF